MPIAPHVTEHAARIVLASHPESELAPEAVRRLVSFGASPRAVQGMVLGSKVRALLDGRYNVAMEDLEALAPLVLRHRLILGFDAQMEGHSPDDVIAGILAELHRPPAGRADPG